MFVLQQEGEVFASKDLIFFFLNQKTRELNVLSAIVGYTDVRSLRRGEC